MGRSYGDLRLNVVGSEPFPRLWNALLTRLDQDRVTVNPPLAFEEHATGRTLTLTRYLSPSISQSSGGGGTQIAGTLPFTVSVVLVGGTYYYTVYPGMVNGITPSGLIANGALNQFNISTGVNYVYLSVTTDGHSVTSVGVNATQTISDMNGSPTTMGAAPTSFTILLAVIGGQQPTDGSEGMKCWQIAYGNALVIPKQSFVSAKSGSYAYGTESFDRWWTWVVYQLAAL